MKYILFLALVAMSKPVLLLAHDGENHASQPWYQDVSGLTMFVGLLVVSGLLGIAAYYEPRYRTILAGVGVVSVLVGLVSFQVDQPTAVPVSESVVAQLTNVPVTVYRTEGCSCCTKFAKELEATGAAVTVTTITPEEMRKVKEGYGISPTQASCHTSVIDDYIVEGHVPFVAIAKLLKERPSTAGITLPGMPIGTPGMPGKQTAVYTVTTLENEPFWQSS